MPMVLVLANILYQRSGPYADVLRGGGFDFRFAECGYRQLVESELDRELKGVDATIAGSEPYTPAIFAAHPRLRVVSRTGVGYDAVHLPSAAKSQTAVCITPGANHDSVAEHAFALLSATARNLPANHAMVASGGFTRAIPSPLRHRVLGLIGYGRTGRAMAIRAVAFGMTVHAHDPFQAGPDANVRFVELDEVFTGSDYISLHAPLTPATHRLINRETISRMKKDVRIVNTSRGSLIDESALAEALRDGRVAGAGLDVFESEPPTGSPLLDCPNVMYSPHVAGVDADAGEEMGRLAALSIVELYQGRFPRERIANAADLIDWKWAR